MGGFGKKVQQFSISISKSFLFPKSVLKISKILFLKLETTNSLLNIFQNKKNCVWKDLFKIKQKKSF
jgi:hypothetical protein